MTFLTPVMKKLDFLLLALHLLFAQKSCNYSMCNIIRMHPYLLTLLKLGGESCHYSMCNITRMHPDLLTLLQLGGMSQVFFLT